MTHELVSQYGADYPYLTYISKDASKPAKEIWRAVRFFHHIYLPLKLSPGHNVLDVGCCLGNLGNTFRYGGVKTTGVDINMSALSAGKNLYGDKSSTINAEAASLPFPTNYFETVISQDVLEHLSTEESLNRVFSEMVRVNKGNKMFHKITVKEDVAHIDDDATHHLKWPTAKWSEWFADQGWKTVKPTTRKLMHKTYLGNFLIEKNG